MSSERGTTGFPRYERSLGLRASKCWAWLVGDGCLQASLFLATAHRCAANANRGKLLMKGHGNISSNDRHGILWPAESVAQHAACTTSAQAPSWQGSQGLLIASASIYIFSRQNNFRWKSSQIVTTKMMKGIRDESLQAQHCKRTMKSRHWLPSGVGELL
jgi:hypothetical protein